MRMRLVLRNEGGNGKVVLPTCYNNLIQAAIYHSVSQELANFLHERGFLFEKRHFKFFTFSRIQGRCRFDRHARQFIYDGDLALFISSPIDRFIDELANTILRRGFFTIGENRLKVIEVAFPKPPDLSGGETKIRMLSPLTVYSTLISPDGKKKTYYYSPYEKEFPEMINSNIKKKCLLLFGKNIKSPMKIKPIGVKEVLVLFKGTVIKGWMGSFVLGGPKSLMITAYETGLGAKNSEGFGMFEVI